jgi:hypothetical protein
VLRVALGAEAAIAAFDTYPQENSSIREPLVGVLEEAVAFGGDSVIQTLFAPCRTCRGLGNESMTLEPFQSITDHCGCEVFSERTLHGVEDLLFGDLASQLGNGQQNGFITFPCDFNAMRLNPAQHGQQERANVKWLGQGARGCTGGLQTDRLAGVSFF